MAGRSVRYKISIKKSISTANLVLILVFVLALIFCSCGPQTSDLPVLRIGHAPHDHHAPLYIAALNPEYFKEHGGIYLEEINPKKDYRLISGGQPLARVTIESITGGKELVRKLNEDHFDISFGGVPALLHFIDQDGDIKIVAPVMTEGSGFAVRKDMPFNDWDGFQKYLARQTRPFRVGYKMALSVQSEIFKDALSASGIPYGKSLDDTKVKVQLLNLYGAKNLVPALEKGLIDGFVVMQPFLAKAKMKGVVKVVAMLQELHPSGKWRGHPCCALAARCRYLKDHPKISLAMLTLFMRANRFIREHPGKSARQIAGWLNISPKVEAESLRSIIFTNEWGGSWQKGLRQWIEMMVSAGALKGKVKKAYQTRSACELICDNEIYRHAKEGL